MAEDIVPKLLDQIKKSFKSNLEKNKKIKAIQKKVKKETATHIDSEEYGIEVGKCLSDAFQENLSSDILPDGKMYYNISERLINDRLHENHRIIHENTKKINQQLAGKANLRLNVDSPINQERINDIINKVSRAEFFDDVKRVLDDPIINFSQSVVDDYIQTSADFQYKAGLKPTITRIVTGHKPCEWCKALGGTYGYPDVPKDVYRRHDNCRCLVDYHPGNGKVQNVHHRQWIDEKKIYQRKRVEQDIKAVNRKSDSRQYKEFLEIIGEKDMPMSLPLFQEMKYNNSERYERLLDHVHVKKKIKTGEWSTKINSEMQFPHNELTSVYGKSYLFKSEDAQALLNEYAGTGYVEKDRHGRRTNREICLIDRPVGFDFRANEATKHIKIHHSKQRTHIVPHAKKGE